MIRHLDGNTLILLHCHLTIIPRDLRNHFAKIRYITNSQITCGIRTPSLCQNC